jgi:divalent metal cation (Fe/Co/Zn/Cd) transporter
MKTRKMGDMIVVDAHIEVNATLTVEQGHDIAFSVQQVVLKNHRVLSVMTHVDPIHLDTHTLVDQCHSL